MGNRQVSVRIKAAFDAAFNATFATADDRIKNMNNALRTLRSTAADVEGLRKTREEVTRLTARLSDQNAELQKVQNSRKEAAAALKVETDSALRAKQAVKSAQAEYRQLAQRLQTFKASMEQSAQPTVAQVEALQRLRVAADTSRNALREISRDASAAARALEKKRQKVDELNARLREHQSALAAAREIAQRTAESHRILRGEFEREKAVLDQLPHATGEQRAALALLGQQAEAAKRSHIEATREVDRLSRSMEVEQQRAREASNSLSSYEARARSASAALEVATVEHRRLTAELDRMRKTMAGRPTEAQRIELQALEKQLEMSRQAVVAAQRAEQAANVTLRDHQAKAREAGKSVEQLSKSERELSTSIGAVSGQITHATEAVKRYEASLEKAGVETHDLQKGSDQLNQTIARQTRAMKSAQDARRLSERARDLRSDAMSHAFFTLGYGYLFTTPIRDAVEFEKAMIRVKAMSGATSEEFRRLKDDARRLGAETVYSAKEVAQAQNELATAGYRTNDIIAIMPSMLALANSSMTGLARTAEITSEVLQGFKIDVSEMERVGDSLTAAYSASASSLESLGEMLKYVSAVAVDVNSSLEQTLAASSVLHNAGIKGSMAGTGLRALFLRLSDPPAKLKKMLKEMNVDIKDGAGNMRNWIDILHDVNKALEGTGTATKAAAWKKLAGEEHAPTASNLAAAEKNGSLRLMEKTLKLAPAFNQIGSKLLTLPDSELQSIGQAMGVKINRAMSGGGLALSLADSLKGLKGDAYEKRQGEIFRKLKIAPSLDDIKPSEFIGTGKKAEAALRQLRINPIKAMGGAKSNEEMTSEIRTQIQTLPLTEQMRYVEIFFSRSRNGFAELFKEFSKGGKDISQLLKALDETLNMKKAQKAFSESTAADLEQVKGDWEDIKISLGESLIPLLKEALTWLKPLTEKFAKWIKENQGFARAIMGVVGSLFAFSAAMAVGKLALSGIFDTIAAGKKIFGFFGPDRFGRKAAKGLWRATKFVGRGLTAKGWKDLGAFAANRSLRLWLSLRGAWLGIVSVAGRLRTAFAAVRAGMLAFTVSNPVLLGIAAAVAAIAIGGYYLWKNWDTIGPRLKAIWANMRTSFASIMSRVVSVAKIAWDFIKTYFSWNPVVYIATHWEKLVGMFKAVYEKIKPYIMKLFPTDGTEIKLAGGDSDEPGFLTRLFGGDDKDDGRFSSLFDSPVKSICSDVPDLPNATKVGANTYSQRNAITVQNTFNMSNVPAPRQVAEKIAGEVRSAFQSVPAFNLFDPAEVS
jgi:TP901 family phage tail tape measure protein